MRNEYENFQDSLKSSDSSFSESDISSIDRKLVQRKTLMSQLQKEIKKIFNKKIKDSIDELRTI